jgi:hypothetical protein
MEWIKRRARIKLAGQQAKVDCLKIAEKKYDSSYYTDKLIKAEVELAKLLEKK